jgi:hypothetical protein
MTVELRPLSFKAEKSRARGDPFHIRADGTVLLKSPPHAWSQARMIGAGAMGETNDLSTPLPTCPGLTLADLAGHLGALYAWVAEIVRAQASQPVDGGPIRDEGSRRPRPRRHRGTAGSAAVRATNRRARWRAPRRRRRRVYRAWRRDQPHGVAHRLVPAHVHLVVGARATPDRETWQSDVAEWAPRTRRRRARVRLGGAALLAVYGRMTGVPAPQIDGDVELWARWQAASAL